MVKEADLLGGWSFEAQFSADSLGQGMAAAGTGGWLVLWPDHLWGYGGGLYYHRHGGARWRLVGDTLWLANDFGPYFHSIIEPRVDAIMAKGHGLGVIDKAVIGKGASFEDLPDSVFWSKAFRDTTKRCSVGAEGICGTWVYQVTKTAPGTLSLTRINTLSRATTTAATALVMKRDSLTSCKPIPGPPLSYTGLFQGTMEQWEAWKSLYLKGCR